MTGTILRWRPDGPSSLTAAVLLSLLIHAAALAVLFFSPAFPSRTWTFGPAYSVDLGRPGQLGRRTAGLYGI